MGSLAFTIAVQTDRRTQTVAMLTGGEGGAEESAIITSFCFFELPTKEYGSRGDYDSAKIPKITTKRLRVLVWCRFLINFFLIRHSQWVFRSNLQ